MTLSLLDVHTLTVYSCLYLTHLTYVCVYL